MPHDLMNKEFGEELKAYNCGKSCIRFKQLKEDTLPLFERILDYCGKHYPDSEFYGRMNAKK